VQTFFETLDRDNRQDISKPRNGYGGIV